MLDLLITEGRYPDFKKGSLVQHNVGIKDGLITYLGDEYPETKQVLDIKGSILSPGFIDIHMHEDNFQEEGDQFIIGKHMLEMGVTTALGGNCGVMYQSVKDFKEALHRMGGSIINYMLLSGYNYYRSDGLSSYQEKVTPEALEQAKKSIVEDLREGASGISFGIEYDPSITFDEILEVSQLAENPDYLVSAHYREDGSKAIEAIEEMIEIAKNIPSKFQIAHLSSCSAMGKMREALHLIHQAMEENPKLNYDTYPYNAFSTTIGSAVFEEGCFEDWGKDYSDILLTDEPYRNQRCDEALFRKARAEHPEMLAVAFVMNEDEIEMAVADKQGMIASDGIIRSGHGHPRAAGTFPRVLGKYVRESGSLDMLTALRKMTFEPAKRLNLKNRGEIIEGYVADLVVFNPDTISDTADFSELTKPQGISHVLIRGQLALEDNNVLHEKLGTFIPFQSQRSSS